jgi:hypothetical protein
MTKRFNGDEFLLESLLGKPLNEAKELALFNGYSIRIKREDNNRFAITFDSRFDRINVELDNGLVTECNFG